MERLRGVVERITFRSETNGYTVLRCRVKGYSDPVTAVGTMAEVHVGSVLLLDGDWKTDPRYGRQFAAQRVEETLPATVQGIEKYLGSGLIRGVGPKFAKRIVRRFGADTLEVLENSPERLLEVSGIGETRVRRIREGWEAQKEIKNIMLFLQSHDVSTAHATKIYKTYGANSIQVVKENPYRLADDIWGIGFKTADAIAMKLGFGRDKYPRLRSGLCYTLNRLSEEGHCYATRDQLLEAGTALLEVEREPLERTLERMCAAQDVIAEEDAVYLPPFFFAETGIVRRLNAIAAAPPRVSVPAEGLAERVESLTGLRYDELQREAVRTAAGGKITLLTGGPGTGKTTATLGILTAFRSAGARILLAAPTGRAAKRLGEATGMEAKTIHRLLEFKPPQGYQRNADAPLEGDVLILDECSMIDALLFYNLLKAVPDGMALVLVGDADQLPSVGAGNVLRDLLDAGRFPAVRLTRIFRQAQASRIIMNAHRINEGRLPDLSNGLQSDFFFLERPEPEAALETVVELVKRRLPKSCGCAPGEIQVLTPMQRGVTGAENLNRVLQEAVNPGGAGLRRGGREYRAGDKVMQIRNNYEKEVFNGDIGKVLRVDTEEYALTVDFDGREVDYALTELEELVHAYAVTIHKSQGSEYPVVVLPLLMSHYIMLQRNLLYTGVTRAKKLLVLVGAKKALACAVRNRAAQRRNTRLKERLRAGAALPPLLEEL